MIEYHSQEMEHMGGSFSCPQYILHKIGPIWAIEQPQRDDPSEWRYFDEETAREEWKKLRKVKRDRLTQRYKVI